jgi:hypothetical protein
MARSNRCFIGESFDQLANDLLLAIYQAFLFYHEQSHECYLIVKFDFAAGIGAD